MLPTTLEGNSIKAQSLIFFKNLQNVPDALATDAFLFFFV